MQWAKNKQGFTIVELLIVVVVIAILASITIVAYNSIQNRAKASAAQSVNAQAVKKIEIYTQTNGGSYPADKDAFLAATGLVDSPSATYDYYASTDLKNYCISVSNSDDPSGRYSYVKTSLMGASVVGKCTMNYVRTPYPTGSGPWTGYNSAGGQTPSYVSSALDGRDSYRWTASSLGFSGSTTVGLEYTGLGIAVPGGTVIAPSIMMRSSKAGTFRLFQSYFNGATGLGDQYGPSVAVPINTWVELTAGTVTTPAASDRMSIRTQYLSGASWVSGDYIEVTKVSTAAGTRTYGDAREDGWFWVGAVNASPSVGPSAVE